MAEPVSAAVAAGVRPVLLECAAHEVGHGLCWKAGGFAVKAMGVRPGLFGGVGNAYCDCRDVWLDAGNIDAYLVGLAGGAAGQARHLITHEGLGRWGARSRSDGNAGWDRAQFRRLAPAHGSRMSWTAAVTAAGRIIGSRSARHDRLTVTLARAGRLSGGAL
jgi:hypothetical protein